MTHIVMKTALMFLAALVGLVGSFSPAYASSQSAQGDECARLRLIGVPCKSLIPPVAEAARPAQPTQEQEAAAPVPSEIAVELEKALVQAPPHIELLYWNGYRFEYIGKNWETYLRNLVGHGKLQKFTLGIGKRLFGRDIKLGGATWSEPESFIVRSDRSRRYAFRVELIRD